MAFCSCDSLIGNTASAGCKTIMGVTTGGFFVPEFDEEGNENGILLSELESNGGLGLDFVNGKRNHISTRQRWYALPGKFANVDATRIDTVTESLNDGSVIRVQNGIKQFSGQLINENPALIGQILRASCLPIGFYQIDASSNLRGVLSPDGTKLLPIPLDKDSVDVFEIEASDTSTQRIQVSWNYSNLVNESQLRQISGEKTRENGVDLNKIEGLFDGNMTLKNSPAATATSFSVDIGTIFGEFGQMIMVEDRILSDFALTVDATNAAITMTSVTEVSEGSYNFVIPTTSGAVTLSQSSIQDGFDLKPLKITLP